MRELKTHSYMSDRMRIGPYFTMAINYNGETNYHYDSSDMKHSKFIWMLV